MPEKKTAKFYPRKKILCPRKKIEISPVKNQKNTLKFLNFCPRKTKCNPRKNLKICPRKLQNAQENLGKSRREKYFSPEKKTTKNAKNWFLGHFSISRVKKNTDLQYEKQGGYSKKMYFFILNLGTVKKKKKRVYFQLS